jgi:glutaminyl-peptide cyclotransferase
MAKEFLSLGYPRLRPGRRVLIVALATAVSGCGGRAEAPDYRVMRRFPHDTAAYTQGLVYARGRLYESVGLLGHSQVRRVELRSGRVVDTVRLPADRFGEGLALLGERLFQLTWKSGVAYVYDVESLARVDSFTYAGEGWGLATDGTSLIMSDGTPTLRVLDPETFRVRREVLVRDHGSPLSGINELEFAGGELFANVYPSDWIVRIDPETGEVRGWIDLARLLPGKRRAPDADVLNGIAFDETSGHLLVTGKRWPILVELRLEVPPGRPASLRPAAR